MSNNTQIFNGSFGLSLHGFYPDDMPSDWQFDYYSSSNNALLLSLDANEDLEEILADIDENFKLVIDISGCDNILKSLSNINKYNNFVLFSSNYEAAIFAKMQSYNFCISSIVKLKIKASCTYFDGKYYYYKKFLVIVIKTLTNDMEIKQYIEKLAKTQQNIILIQKHTDNDVLNKTKMVCELLGLYKV